MFVVHANQVYRFAAKKVFYHGTASGENNEILRAILKEGLNPDPKRRVFEGDETEQDPSSPDWHKRSIETLGGVYFTDRPQTADSFANGARRKFGGNNVIIVAQLETRAPSTRIDEDILFAGRDFFYDTYKRTKHGLLANEWGTLQDLIHGVDWEDVASTFVEEKVLYYWPNISGQRIKAILPLLAEALKWQTEYWMAKNVPTGGWSLKHQYEEEYIPVDPGVALQNYRKAADAVMQKFREVTEEKTKGGMDHRLRVVEPVGYKGANRILAVLMYRDYIRQPDFPYHTAGEVVYSTPAASSAVTNFIEAQSQFMGPNMYWTDKDGTVLYDEPKEEREKKVAS